MTAVADHEAAAKQYGVPTAIVDDLQHAGAAAEEDDLNDVGEREILEAPEQAHECSLSRAQRGISGGAAMIAKNPAGCSNDPSLRSG